ncbi:MAG: S8 family peptidase [Comamonadaceae bacterium]|jgi:subtilisin family serine protease|uniref:S8 family peptidase n=1 Tax=Candidatus Skiveiella danica TaxID=3386177 RepID=UPI00390A7E92|nr:S8 family peptidase [Comamonadaceae bacterium]MBK9988144.1 S8 family peptidase [Betaproteobacteria bacterium]MBK6928125.1 S8 family peptidase [Comamonadaceae bacterium]MBK7118200.1 S8 family peptidase [Comamonadaceae bacterium]MBK7506801.1 S8 family peptidase [Comamonadaceae bacterium]
MRLFLSSRFAAGLAVALVGHLGVPIAFAQVADPPATYKSSAPKRIPGRYIVVFKDHVMDTDSEADKVIRGRGGVRHLTFSHGLKGFVATLSDAALAGVRNEPNVDYVEQDQVATINATENLPPGGWGLDRIDQVDRPLDSLYQYSSTGKGVNAFIIDTGIRASHQDFAGRVLPGYSAIADANGTNDCNGHGTHVAGTVGGTTWGVAKGVKLIPVRVLDCSGSGAYSGVIAGIDWVANSPLRPAVANLSLGGGASAALDAAIAGAVSKGVNVVVAAGNNNADACNYSPSRAPSAITVGATTSSDTRASYSNYGSCLDIFAPGSSILSAWNTSDVATNTISGTSMASPHVAGVVALVLEAKPTASPSAVTSFLTTSASLNKLSSIGTNSPNRLVYSLAAGTPQEPLNKVVAVKSIAGKTASSYFGWTASVTVTIRDVNTGANVSNAMVKGSFSTGGSVSCTTSSVGSCSLASGTINRKSLSTTLSITDVSGTGMTYDASQNSATQIVISKP